MKRNLSPANWSKLKLLSALLTAVVPFSAQTSVAAKTNICVTLEEGLHLPPTADQLLDHIYGVHAFSESPRSGIMQVKTRPTKHFALGSLVPPHRQYNYDNMVDWGKKDFAVLKSLRSLLPQVISINTYDTFILGSVTIGAGDILILPINRSHEAPPEVTIVTYTKGKETLSEAVNRTLAAHGLWQFKMENEVKGEARWRKNKVNNPQFFSELLKLKPNLSFGTHVRSIVGKGYMWGILDQVNFVLTDKNSSLYSDELNLAKAINTIFIGQLAETIDLAHLPPHAKETLKQYVNRIHGYNLLIDLIFQSQTKEGFTLSSERIASIAKGAADQQTVASNFEAQMVLARKQKQLHEGKDYKEFNKSVDTNGILVGQIHKSAFNAETLGQLLRVVSPDDLEKLRKLAPDLFTNLNPEMFNLIYAMSRVLEIGYDRAIIEKLLDTIKVSYEKISPKPNLQDIAYIPIASLVGKLQIYWIDDQVENRLRNLHKLEDARKLIKFTSSISDSKY